MIRLLHLADVHLDAPLGGFGKAGPARREEVLEAFGRLPEAAEEEGAHAVLVAGDLFDGPRPSREALAVARRAFERLQEAGRPVLIVPGNHDAITLHPNPWGRDLGGAWVFREPVFGPPRTLETEAGPLHVYGLAHDAARHAEPLKTFRKHAAEGTHVVLLHGSVPAADHWEAGPGSLSLPVAGLAVLEADYVALGDHHGFRPPESFGRDGPPACYAGSFAALDLTETGPRGCAVVSLAPGEPPEVRLRPSGVAPVADLGEVDVGSCGDPEEVVERVEGRLPEGELPCVTLVGAPAFPLDAEDVRERLRERHPAVRLRDRTVHVDSRHLDDLAEEDTVAGHVVRLGRDRVRAAEAAGGDEEAELARRALREALRALEAG